MRINSITFKIGIIFTAILGALLIAYSAVLHLSLRRILYINIDRELAYEVIIGVLENRIAVITVTIPVFLLAAGFIGRWMALKMLRPIRDLTHTAQEITLEDLSARVSTEHLEAEMRELADAFNAMISRMERSVSYVSQFSSHAAHELKTPLAVMRNTVELAMRRKEGPCAGCSALSRVDREIRRMLTIIEDLLLLSRLDYREDPRAGFEDFALDALLCETIAGLTQAAEARGVDVVTDTPCGSHILNGHRGHIQRMLVNLLHNAIKFTPTGGRVQVIVRYDSDTAFISIADTGPGIPREELPFIFDRFYQARSVPASGDPGSGLGLSIARAVARMHRGDILVETGPGEGSVFTVVLPRRHRDAVSGNRDINPADSRGGVQVHEKNSHH